MSFAMSCAEGGGELGAGTQDVGRPGDFANAATIRKNTGPFEENDPLTAGPRLQNVDGKLEDDPRGGTQAEGDDRCVAFRSHETRRCRGLEVSLQRARSQDASQGARQALNESSSMQTPYQPSSFTQESPSC